MRRRRRISTEERAYIDVVPLVDTLLAVFLFLAILAFQSPITFLAVKLPFAKEGQKEVLSTLRVQVLENGQYMWDGKILSIEDLNELISKNKPKSIIIEADENTRHKYVVFLMDIAKGNGVENLVIATKSRR